ncbi:MAG TPA: CaiB/BaiF CoA-transferase family protein [Streptosporangiaceae bacterium]|nr:CaiB/BaiF CoA-transferase family protein [Streptosporangiaceae bacterium]
MSGPLTGIVVADLTRALAGPHATMLLGDLGARVIKVEQPGTGDECRHWGPPFAGPPDDQVSTYFLSCNRNKESVTCNLKSADGRILLARLARHCDVLVENFRPGVLDRAGFGPSRLHELNPRLVICSISGFGHDGPEHERPGYDQIVQGEAGLMSVTGPDRDHPVKSGLSVADILAGVNAAVGVLAALVERQQTGRGRVVRTSLLASVVGAHAFQGTRWTVAGEVPHMTGNHHPSIAPYGAFRCADGLIQIGVANEQQWRRFAAIGGLDPDDERFLANHLRVTHRDELTAEIEARLVVAGRAHWLGLLGEAGVPAGSIRTIDEVYQWEQTLAQGLVITVRHPVLGSIDLPGPALRFEDDGAADGSVRAGADARDGHLEHAPPPLLGQHDAVVRAWLDEKDAAGRRTT